MEVQKWLTHQPPGDEISGEAPGEEIKRGPSRIVCMVDSYVTRCALGKGRSASIALSSVIRRIASTMVSFGQYLVTPFCPTRLNCADDPTRDRELRRPVKGLNWRALSEEELWALASIRLTKGWASNWIRLVLLLMEPYVAELSNRALYRYSRPSSSLASPCPSTDGRTFPRFTLAKDWTSIRLWASRGKGL